MTLAAWAYRQMSFRLYHLLCASLCVKQDLSLSLYSCIPWGDESAVCVCDLVAGSSRKEPRLWVVPGILSLITGAVTKKTDDKEISLHSPELWLPGAVGSHDALDLPSYLTAEHGSCAPSPQKQMQRCDVIPHHFIPPSALQPLYCGAGLSPAESRCLVCLAPLPALICAGYVLAPDTPADPLVLYS